MTPSSNVCSRPGCRCRARPGWLGDNAVVIERIEHAVDDLDVTIKHIRSAIFGLSTTADSGDGVRDRAIAPAGDGPGAGVRTAGRCSTVPIDTTMPDAIADDLLATIGEALTNVARHALREPGRRRRHRRATS